MDYEAKKQELMKRSLELKDNFIGKLVNELNALLKQQRDIQTDLNELEAEKKPAKK
jgi:hypothetical protein